MSGNVHRVADLDDQWSEGSLAFEVSCPFDVVGLEEEIVAAHNWRKTSGLVVLGNPALAEQGSPVTLWVLRAGADVETVRRVIESHELVKKVDA